MISFLKLLWTSFVLILLTGCEAGGPLVPEGGTTRRREPSTISHAPCVMLNETAWDAWYERMPTGLEVERCGGKDALQIHDVYCCRDGTHSCHLIMRGTKCRR